MVGRESLVGGLSALDGDISPYKVIVQIAGSASVVDARRLRRLANASIAVRTALARHEELILVQALQSAACNATHSVGSRLARWLLRCRDIQGGQRPAPDAGISRPDVGCSAQRRLSSGDDPAKRRSHHVQPRPYQDRRFEGPAIDGLRMLQDGQIQFRAITQIVRHACRFASGSTTQAGNLVAAFTSSLNLPEAHPRSRGRSAPFRLRSRWPRA